VTPPPQLGDPLHSMHWVPLHWMAPEQELAPEHRTVHEGTDTQRTPLSHDSSPQVTSHTRDASQSMFSWQPSRPEQSTLHSYAVPQLTPSSQDSSPQITAQRTPGGQLMRSGQTSRALQSRVQTSPTQVKGEGHVLALQASGPPVSVPVSGTEVSTAVSGALLSMTVPVSAGPVSIDAESAAPESSAIESARAESAGAESGRPESGCAASIDASGVASPPASPFDSNAIRPQPARRRQRASNGFATDAL
jgi:hypothetical protein